MSFIASLLFKGFKKIKITIFFYLIKHSKKIEMNQRKVNIATHTKKNITKKLESLLMTTQTSTKGLV